MEVIDLLKDIKFNYFEAGLLSREIKDIKIDHREVEEGDMFIALRGEKHNGNDYIEQALARGASCVVSDERSEGERLLYVENARSAYAKMSKCYFKNACDSLRIVAVTGTNGKTTTCNTIADMLRGAGLKVGVIGTLGAQVKELFEDTGFTTPDPYKLHSIFAQMKANQDEFVIMEASAHAFALNKLDGINFEIGVLTNITEDHLDFFGDMDSYANAKFKLFENGRVKLGIYCDGKPYMDVLKEKSGVTLQSYGFNDNCDFSGKILKKTLLGSHFTCSHKDTLFDVKTPLVGDFNIENAMAAIAVCKNLGINDYNIMRGLNRVKPVEGRFNVFKKGDVKIVVDFAHTPDGIENVLSTARELSDGKVVAIFGCGGNRDKLKRPIMGRIASQWTDEIILTSDNPRYENPYEIISEIKAGVKGKCKVIENRKEAIQYALSHYQNNETIVIAGKGAEKYQEIMGVKYPYSDYDVLRDCIGEEYMKSLKSEFYNFDEKF